MPRAFSFQLTVDVVQVELAVNSQKKRYKVNKFNIRKQLINSNLFWMYPSSLLFASFLSMISLKETSNHSEVRVAMSSAYPMYSQMKAPFEILSHAKIP